MRQNTDYLADRGGPSWKVVFNVNCVIFCIFCITMMCAFLDIANKKDILLSLQWERMSD